MDSKTIKLLLLSVTIKLRKRINHQAFRSIENMTQSPSLTQLPFNIKERRMMLFRLFLKNSDRVEPAKINQNIQKNGFKEEIPQPRD
jgi:hypothetical protein